MNDYKSTLNLPKTDFPMRGNLVEREPKTLKRWISDDLYRIVRNAKKGKKIFLLHDGPPYANGNIHIGHSVNKILKDIIIKYKNLAGFYSPYVPGWDCHGLPIELRVEQKYGKPGKQLTITEFCAKCREYAITQINNQREDFIRMGILGDWIHPYLTMDFKTEANTILTLSKLIDGGYLYKDIKPVNWCIDCSSTLAEAEVKYYDRSSLSVDVAFEAINQDLIKDKFNLTVNISTPISIVIWTTTPWTLPASRAISLSPEFDYALILIKNKALILAKSLAENVMKRLQITEYIILGTIKGTELELMRFKHPFLNYDVPIVLSNHVTLEAGTGAVHIAGSYSQDDYKISLKYNLEIVNLVGPDGTYLPGTYPGVLDGINIFKANDIIVNLLINNDTILCTKKINHSCPCCWRHKSPIILRTTSQWFVNLNHKGLRKQLLKEIKNVQWIPNWSKEHIKSMIINRPDWCISRQRTWGIPMSLFIHKKTHDLHPRTPELMKKIAKLVEFNGIQAWWDLDPRDILGNDADIYKKTSDILDVWFDSGSTNISVIEMRPEFIDHTAADVYLEGSDQHRGWFMSSLIISTAIKGIAPYRQVITHGFAVDDQGRKMSKSTGNIISPQNVINKFGADILRLWVASTNYKDEIVISDEVLKRIIDNYRRIRNTARFILANLNDFDPVKNIIRSEEMIMLDRWAVSCTKLVQEKIIKAYEAYNFHEVIKHLLRFCSIEMGSFYLDIIKDRQYTLKANSLARRSCQTALYHIIEALVRWIAPIISFTADEIWSHLPGKREKYVFTSEWYEKLFDLDETHFMNNAFWNELIKIRSEINKLIEQERIHNKLGSSLELAIKLYAKPNLAAKLIVLGKDLKFVLLTSNAEVFDYSQATTNAKQSEIFEGKLKILLNKAKGRKCLRCWHYTTDVDLDINIKYEGICRRCINNIIGDGEKRKFV